MRLFSLARLHMESPFPTQAAPSSCWQPAFWLERQVLPPLRPRGPPAPGFARQFAPPHTHAKSAIVHASTALLMRPPAHPSCTHRIHPASKPRVQFPMQPSPPHCMPSMLCPSANVRFWLPLPFLACILPIHALCLLRPNDLSVRPPERGSMPTPQSIHPHRSDIPTPCFACMPPVAPPVSLPLPYIPCPDTLPPTHTCVCLPSAVPCMRCVLSASYTASRLPQIERQPFSLHPQDPLIHPPFVLTLAERHLICACVLHCKDLRKEVHCTGGKAQGQRSRAAGMLCMRPVSENGSVATTVQKYHRGRMQLVENRKHFKGYGIG